MSAQQLVQAVQAAASVTATVQERKQAVAVVEHAKSGDAQTCVQAFFLLFQSTDAGDQLNGLTLLRHVLRNHWDGLQADQQEQLLQFITAATVDPNVSNRAQPIRMQLAYATSDLLILSGEQATEHMLSTGIVQMLQQDAVAAVIGSKVIQFLSEEVAETPLSKRNGSAVFSGGSEASKRRRSLLSSLQTCSSPLLSLLIAAASAYMQTSISNTSQGQVSEAEKNHSAVRASLEALAALSSWLPLKILKDSQLLDICSSLLQSPPLQAHAVEVLMQISNRSSKQASKDGDDYKTVFTQVASILVAAVPLVAPTNTPLPRLLESDETADAACRMCSAVSDFVTCGHLQSVPRELQLQVLLQLAGYLGSAYLPLASLTFAAWRRLVQGHERLINKAPGAAPSCGVNAVVELPQECLQIVLQHSVKVLDIVIVAPGTDGEVPEYMDTLAEWREMCGICKSAIKYILGEVASGLKTDCLPAVWQVAEVAQAKLKESEQAGASYGEQVAAAGHALDVTAFVLDAVMGPMCAFQLPAEATAALTSLCEHLTTLQPGHVALVPRVGKVLESLGPVLVVEPVLAQRVVEAFFALIDRMHTLQGGRAQGQNDSAPYTKEQRALTKCYFTLASKAPSALVPFLEAIAQRTISLVDSGVLGYADKNVICEGLLLSAARDGPDLFGRVVSALISPIRASWENLLEQLPNAEALINVMLMPCTEGQNGVIRIGGNDARSFAYYSLQLLLFCARQAKSCEVKVINTHMEWMLLPAVRLHQCLMGLARPDLRNGGPLTRVREILDISPLERASCMNQQAFLEAKSRTDELEPGRMDPTSSHGVRGWIRQCKELAMMLVTECASGVPEFWGSERLCSVVPRGLLDCLEHQEPRAMRLVVHHVFIPLVRSCPPAAATRWLAPALRQILPIVQNQLQNMWVERAARAAAQSQGHRGTQTEDDIVQEVLLRELSRDVLEAIRALFGSTSFPSIPHDRLKLLSTGSSNAFSTIQRLRAANMQAAANDSAPADGAEKQPAASYNSIAWDQTVAHALMTENHDHILAAASLAAAAMRWPDQHTQLRAVSACRTISVAAGAPLNPVASTSGIVQPHAAPLVQLLVPCILPEAVMALASADGGNVVTELLLLIRSVYVAYAAATPSPASKIQELMPSVSNAALDQMNADLQSNKTEKHHKDVLKRFFVAAGFVNLEALNEQRVSTAAVGSIAQAGDASMTAFAVEDEIQWPDLYDVAIE